MLAKKAFILFLCIFVYFIYISGKEKLLLLFLQEPEVSFAVKNWSQHLVHDFDNGKTTFGKNDENYDLLYKNENEAEIRKLLPILPHIYDDFYGKCFPKTLNLHRIWKWTVKPEICTENINMVLVIRSSIYRTSFRTKIRQSWGKLINTDK